MSDQLTWDEIIQMLYASPQYQNGGGGLGGKTVQQNLNLLQDFQQLTGVPFVQLLGGGAQEFQPHTSDTGQIYGNNPMFAQAFSNITAGYDPIQILEDMKANPDAYHVDKSVVGDSNWQKQTLGVLEKYAYESSAAARYNAENANSYTVGGKTYQGDPNIFSNQSQFDLLGAPTVDELMQRYADSYMANQKSQGRTADVLSYDQWLAQNPDKKISKPKDKLEARVRATMPTEAQSWSNRTDISWASPDMQNLDYVKYKNEGDRKNRDLKNKLGLNDPNSAAYQAYSKAYTERLNKAKQTRVASDAEKALVAELMFARGIIGA